MKLLCSYITFILITFLYGQEPILLDSLTIQQKKNLKDQYSKRKETFYASTENWADKKELKKIRFIFDEMYKDLDKSIDKNEILINTPLNQYLNRLLTSIQKQNPKVPQDIFLLVSREFETNARNMGEGTIIINNYLIHSLDNEDQLAYILCHEMAHQSLNHVFNSIKKHIITNNSTELKSKTKELKKQKYNSHTQAENLLKEIAYKNSKESRKKEVQADSLGFIFYSQLKRDKQQPSKALQKLRDSDKEPDSLSIADYKKIFTTSNIKVKDEWFLMENYDMYHYKQSTKFNTDSLRTHPHIDERISNLAEQFPEIKQDNKKSVKPIPSEEFTQWKKNAVYQNIYSEYLLENYGNSLYEALKLYNRHPDAFLKKMIGLNFQKLYKAKKAYRLNRYVSQVNMNKFTNSYNLFCSFIFNLNLSDLEYFTQTYSNK